MAYDDLVRVKLENGAVTSVGRSFADSHGLKILKDDDGREVQAATASGTALDAEMPSSEFEVTMRGAELDEALTAAGLSTSGKLAEKQQRLAEFQASQASAGQPVAVAGANE